MEKYEEALEKAKAALDKTESAVTAGVLREIFPELAIDKDERIRKDIIYYLTINRNQMTPNQDWDCENKWIPWLEKQGEKKLVEMKSAEESLGIGSEEYNKIVDECIYGKQKPVEWSEEDKNLREATIGLLNLVQPYDAKSWGKSRFDCIDWLRTLRPQKQWKPTEIQLESLKLALYGQAFRLDELQKLYDQLKEL